MPLYNILADLASAGFSIRNDAERAVLVKKINDAIEELYVPTDLDQSLGEVVLSLDTSSDQVCLPPYCGQVRGCRYTESGSNVELNNIIPRYHAGIFNKEAWALRFRELPRRPLFRNITNESILKLSIPAVDTIRDFSVIVNGSNSNSSIVQEIVTFTKDVTTLKLTTNIFREVRSIVTSFSTARKYDLSIKDANDVLLGVLPNNHTKLEHIVFQVSESLQGGSNLNSIEVCFKWTLVPLTSDYDEFICGSKYDKAIYWKVRENYSGDTQKDIQAALAAKQKGKDIINGVGLDSTDGKTLKLNFAPNPVYSILRSL